MNISVVIPVYNAQSTLKVAVESVISQITPDDQIILVNDGSSDQSGAICDELASSDQRIRVVHQSNQGPGPSGARNAGITVADRDYLVFVDADDVWIDETWAKIKAELDGQDPPTVVMFDYEERDMITQKRTPHIDYHPSDHRCLNGVDFVRALGEQAPNFGISALRFVVKRDFVLAHQLWFEQGVYYEDVLWTFQMLFVAPSVKYLPVLVYSYSQNVPQQITGSFSVKKLQDRLRISAYWLNKAGQYLDDSHDIKRFLGRISVLYFSTLIAFRGHPRQHHAEFLDGLTRQKVFLRNANSPIHQAIAGLCRMVGINVGSRLVHTAWNLRSTVRKQLNNEKERY